MFRHSVITAFLGQTKDRFHVYNEPKTVDEKFAMVAATPGLEAVEIIYPYEVSDADETKALLKKHGLQVSAVNVNIKAEPEFRSGGITSPITEVRAKAVQIIKDAKDFAVAIGADKVTCCPLGDGYEFNFQADYIAVWERLKETFGEAAEYYGDFPLMIEYKPSETRGRCYLDDAAKTLALINAVGRPNLGVTLDYGHSTYGDNNPAEELALIHSAGVPYYIHINDNNGKWDWDFFCGSHTFLAYVEFLYYLRKFGYTDFVTSDTSPTRWDIQGTFEVNTRLTGRVEKLLKKAGEKKLAELVADEDYLATWKFIEDEILGLKNLG
jgi:xylose isomerase